MIGKEPERTENQRGPKCRYCGSKYFRLLYARRGWGDKLIRRREYRDCWKRVTTREKAGVDATMTSGFAEVLAPAQPME